MRPLDRQPCDRRRAGRVGPTVLAIVLALGLVTAGCSDDGTNGATSTLVAPITAVPLGPGGSLGPALPAAEDPLAGTAAPVVQLALWQPDSGDYCASGAGTIVAPGNLVLANLATITPQGDDGRSCAPNSLIAVFVEPDLRVAPQFAGYADVVARDEALGLAVLRGTQVPGALGSFDSVPPASLGVSEGIAAPQLLVMVGFEAFGGVAKSVASGTVASVSADTEGAGSWIRVSSAPSFVDGGGGAFDAGGQLVAMPRQVAMTEEGPMALLRPIDEARPLIDQAIAATRVTATTPVPATVVPESTPAPPPTSTPGSSAFTLPPTTLPSSTIPATTSPATTSPAATSPATTSAPSTSLAPSTTAASTGSGYAVAKYDPNVREVILSSGKSGGGPADRVQSLPEGARQACVFWSVSGIPTDALYDVRWTVDGATFDVRSNAHWLGGASLVNWCRPLEAGAAGGVPSGHHVFVFSAAGTARFKLEFDVG